MNLGEQADCVLKLLAGRCQHAGVVVDTDYIPAAGLALAEAGRIRQVILNLALNALDAMPHGGKLSIAVVPADADATDATNADTGAGDWLCPVGGGFSLAGGFLLSRALGRAILVI